MSNPNRHVKASGRAWENLRRAKWAESHTCYLCGHEVAEWADYHLDHIDPDKLGGLPTKANTAVAHKKCNLAKGAKTLEQFALEQSHDTPGSEDW